jgi:hypothetical protein
MKRAVLAALAVLFAFPAFAAPNCASTADVVSLLTQRYGEAPIARGTDDQGRLVLWWGNPETGSWTATITAGDETCIAAQGGSFERLALEPNV